MRPTLRIVASLNALFQLLVGLLCVLSPSATASVFQLAQTGPSVFALIRMFGGLLFGCGLLSALVAHDPDRNRDLPALLATACAVNVAADAIVVGSGDMLFGQLAVGVILQLLVIGVAIGYVAKRAPRG
jgi:hypothetical protein